MSRVKKESATFELRVAMRCPCEACPERISKAMNSIKKREGVESSFPDIHNGKVTVVGKVDPFELRDWLKKKISKDVQVIFPNPHVQKPKQTLTSTTYEERWRKITTTTRGPERPQVTSTTYEERCRKITTTSRGPEKPQVTSATYEERCRKITTTSRGAEKSHGSHLRISCPAPSAPPLCDSTRSIVPSDEKLRSLEKKIRDLERFKDHQKIKHLEEELDTMKRELGQYKKVIQRNRSALLDGAITQLNAVKDLEGHTLK